MDPWVHMQIRLANRQNLLTGRELSSLQVTASLYCEIEESIERKEQTEHRFKYALLATGRWQIEDLFPEIFTEVVEDDTAEMESGEQSVTYKFSEHQLSPEEMERQLAKLMGGGEVTINGQEVASGLR